MGESCKSFSLVQTTTLGQKIDQLDKAAVLVTHIPHKSNKTMKYILIIILAISFLISPTLLMLNEYFVINLNKSNIELIENIQKYQLAVTTGLISLLWVTAFLWYKKGEKNKNLLHHSAGILGVFIALASLSGLMFFEHWLFIVLFSFSGIFCIYCVSVPAYEWFSSKLRREKFEIGILSFIFGTITLYIIDAYSNVLINSIFGINEQYFRFSKPIAMLLVTTPLFAFISLSFLVFFVVFTRKNTLGSDSFYKVNIILACYVVLVLSITFGSKSTKVIEIIAGEFDFNTASICKINIDQKGVIILDPAHTKALVKTIEKNKNLYTIQSCNTLG